MPALAWARSRALHVGGLAVASGGSLFVFGPPGNGKTSLGRLLHRALPGEVRVPHCIGIDSSVIRVSGYDNFVYELIRGLQSIGLDVRINRSSPSTPA